MNTSSTRSRPCQTPAQPGTLPPVTMPAAGSEPVPMLGSQALFGPHRRIYIRHGDAVYQLRITAQDKLILTK